MYGPLAAEKFSTRILALGLILGSEALLASILVDTKDLTWSGGWLTGFVGAAGPWLVRCLIAFTAIFATFAYLKCRVALTGISEQIARFPIRRNILLLHIPALVAFAGLSAVLLNPRLTSLSQSLIAAMWMLAGAGAVASCTLALLPLAIWATLAARTGKLWLFSLTAAVAGCSAGALTAMLWAPASKVTFQLVKLFLDPFVQEMVIRPERMLIGTPRFTAIISPECSGLEGVGLLLVFGLLWLVLFREESRFPHALILLPAALIVLFLLNAVRIAVLILIGNTGAREIAAGGFHSQAGWIAFNSVAFGFCIAARRIPWFSRLPSHRVAKEQVEDHATSAYLVPFLVILAAGILSRALSGEFEWFYGLRFVAAAAALWYFRSWYAEIEWKFGWPSFVIGGSVFILWIALDAVFPVNVSHPGVPAALAGTYPQLRIGWIALRVLTAVIAVPVAEELAFRGFLLRRLESADFTAVPFRKCGWFPVLASSVLFGVLHGDRWFAGTLAGVLYARAATQHGRLGDAVMAHTLTNGLLAVYVLTTGTWYLW